MSRSKGTPHLKDLSQKDYAIVVAIIFDRIWACAKFEGARTLRREGARSIGIPAASTDPRYALFTQ